MIRREIKYVNEDSIGEILTRARSQRQTQSLHVQVVPLGPIWGNKGHNKTLPPSRSVLGHMYSAAVPGSTLISPSFAITMAQVATPPPPALCVLFYWD